MSFFFRLEFFLSSIFLGGMTHLLTILPILCATSSIPIRWSNSLPEIEIYISFDNRTVLSRWVPISTRVNGDVLRFFDPSATWAEPMVVDVGFVSDSTTSVRWREDAIRTFRDCLDDFRLIVSPMSEFSYSVFSFAFTPSALVINQRDLSQYCRNPVVSVRMFAAISDEDNWGFYINNIHYVIDSTENHIVLTENDFSDFWSNVRESLNEHHISISENHLILDCQMDMLDEILPTLSFIINDRHDLEILITPEAYIQQVDHNGTPACYVAVRPDESPVLGTPLFRHHTVIFETDTARIGICEI